MKQLSWFVVSISLLLLCQCVITAAAARTLGLGKACRTRPSSRRTCKKGLFCNASTLRCARLGGLGAPCKHASTDCKLVKASGGGAVCFQKQCFGNTARPKLAPCTADGQCVTGYCGKLNRCALQHAEGGVCRRPQQCMSGACDTLTAKCVSADGTLTTTTTMSTTPTTTTVTTASASSTPALVAASAARASATPASNSRAYTTTSSSPNNRPLLQRNGQVDTFGNVNIVSTTPGAAAIRLIADSSHPAVVQQILNTPLHASSSKPVTLVFHYVVKALQADAHDGQCSIVPFVNDKQLTPSVEVINAVAQDGTATFTYTNTDQAVTSYAISVVCDGVASSTTVDVDTVTITATPPTCSSILSNCGFETGTTSADTDWSLLADGQSTGSITGDEANVRTGSYAYQCTIESAGDRCGLARSVSAGSLTPGATYGYSLWVKSTTSASTTVRLTCTVGTGTATYFSSLADPSSAAGDDSFRQYTATFTVGDDLTPQDVVDLQCYTQDVDTVVFDDFDIAKTAAPGVSYLPTGQCRGLTNCGFEQTQGGLSVVDLNGNADLRALCVPTTEPNFVRSGQSVKLCSIASPSSSSTQPPYVYLQGGSEDTYTVGATYVWTFWLQLSGGATTSNVQCAVWADDGDGAAAYKGPCPFTTAKQVNGFRQVAIAFTAPSPSMSVFVAMDGAGRYAFDDVSMLDDDNGAVGQAIQYGSTGTPGSSDVAFTQTCVGGLINCGFETGYANGYALNFGPSSSCAVTPRSSATAHDGSYALQCDTTADAASPLLITPSFRAAGVLAGRQYTFSFWCKTTAGNSISAIVDNSAPQPMTALNGGTVDANGFAQYAITYTAATSADQPSLAVKMTTPATYSIDSFALALVPLLPSVPQADCTYLPDCDFEQTYLRYQADSDYVAPSFVPSGRRAFAPNNQAGSVLAGQWAMSVTPISGTDGYLESDTSSGGGTPYVVGATYVWTFWKQTTTIGINCVVWARNGQRAVAYKGTCPMTTAPAVNGFRQIAIPFTATDTQMDVMIITTTSPSNSYTSLAVDNFSVLTGQYTIPYDTSSGAPVLTIGSATTTQAQPETCTGFTNCGFESGLPNGLSWDSWGMSCAITSDLTNVYDGAKAFQCTSGDPHYLSFAPHANVATLRAGNTYTFSFWLKVSQMPALTPVITAIRKSDRAKVTYSPGTFTVLTSSSSATKGFAQLGTTFTVLADAEPQVFGFGAQNGISGSFWLDKFDLRSSM